MAGDVERQLAMLRAKHDAMTREFDLLCAAIREVVRVNDSPEGAIGDVRDQLGDDAAAALQRALWDEREVEVK